MDMLSAVRCTLVRVSNRGAQAAAELAPEITDHRINAGIGDAGAGTFQFNIDLAWPMAVMQTDAEPCGVIVLVASGLKDLRLPDPAG